MNPMETASNNTRSARGGTEGHASDFEMVDAEKIETERVERSEVDSKKKTVIFICDTREDPVWLAKMLTDDSVKPIFVPLSLTKDDIEKYEATGTSSVICIYSVKSENNLSHLYSSLEISIEKFSHEKVNVVFTDLEDERSSLELKKQWSTENYPGCQLLALTHAEMGEIKNPEAEKKTHKMEALRQILQDAKDVLQNRHNQMRHNEPKLQIGIFSWCDQDDYSWLMSLIKTEKFKDLVEDIKPNLISNNESQKFKNDVHQYTFAILYHSLNRGRNNVTDIEGALYDEELKCISKHLGKQMVIVVIDDFDGSGDPQKTGILQQQPSIGKLARELILFSKEEKESDYMRFTSSFQIKKKTLKAMMMIDKTEANEDRKPRDGNTGQNSCHTVQKLPGDGHYATKQDTIISSKQDQSAAEPSHCTDVKKRDRANINKEKSEIMNHSKAASLDNLKNTAQYCPQGPTSSLFSQISRYHVVGFFSSSANEDYSWLVALANRHCKQVFSCYIGHSGFRQFMDDVDRCTFGILYHTMTRGRINITDVADALYDQELQYMSNRLGPENVIVVVDDVVDSSDQEKDRILNKQPSIRRLSRDLILINKLEKKM